MMIQCLKRGVFILFFILQAATCEDIKDLNFKELLQLAQDTSRINLAGVKNDDVKFFLYTRSSEEIRLVANETIDLNKSAKILIHGWIANIRRSWYKEITEEFLKKDDCNVIQVDWERPARSAYLSSAINTKLIGKKIAEFILQTKIPPQNIHLVGHSLGAHIAGFAGKEVYKTTGRKVSRISGLDPAGPYFQEHVFEAKERLDKEDAEVVDIIHTDAGIYGISFPIGSFDIFVNKGKAPQPACSYDLNVNSVGELVENTFCSHAISTSYFAEWINNGKFRCRICHSWSFYLINLCSIKMDLSESDVDENVTGICVTETHQTKPYLIK